MRRIDKMQWNTVSAIASSISTIAIIAGGAIAIYQIRESRRAAQFDATQRMVGLVLEREFNEALRFIMDVLPSRMTEEQYVAELQSSRGWDVDPSVHKELIILARLEEIGIYLRYRLLFGEALLDFTAELILQSWEHLQDVVELMRTSHRNPHVWSNAEYLYQRARAVRRSPN